MADTPNPPAGKPPKTNDNAFFGHPRGLSSLFFTEMWERFSYYGMRAILVIFLKTAVDEGGFGWDKADASTLVGIYMSLVYLMSLPGGWIADRFLGQRKAVLYGGTLITFGHVCLAMPGQPVFFAGLGFIIMGTGLLKPNVSAMVGGLYSPEDARRNAGYAIYYMGINLGATFAPTVIGTLAQNEGFRNLLVDIGLPAHAAWHFAFGAAAVCMFFGLVTFVMGWKRLGTVGMSPAVPDSPKDAARDRKILAAILAVVLGVPMALAVAHVAGAELDLQTIGDVLSLAMIAIALVLFVVMYFVMARDLDERRRVIAMMVLFFGCVSFFAIFDQAATTLTIFADEHTNNSVFGIAFPSSWWQFVNPAFILLLSPFFGVLWIRMAKKGTEPAATTKFGIGMIFTAISFLVMLPAIHEVLIGPILAATKDHPAVFERSSPLWLLLLYFFSTLGELLISPVGLSSMSTLAPARMGGMVMGVWFLAISIGDYIAGRAESISTSLGPTNFFLYFALFALAVAVILLALSRPITRLLGRKT
ncbi:MAG: peptide MFS transporter [Deltaproteobacteria bacterium]|nr:peptide MFS transporter [Deltaproteobacteria bacterium]